MITLIKRFKSNTPKFWNKAAWLGGVLTAISVGLLAAPAGIELPGVVQTIAGYMATAGFVLTVVAKATTSDQDLSDQ